MKSSNIYRHKFKKFGVSPKSLLWKSRGAAHQRFRQFWAEIDFTGKSVLDVGCGFGEMGSFLTKRYKDVTYKGIDITPEFIKSGKKLYPHLDLKVANFFDLKNSETFDVVLASGVLNSNYNVIAGEFPVIASEAKQSPLWLGLLRRFTPRNDRINLEYRQKAISKMFSLTSDCLAFNMLGGHPAPENKKESNIWYSNSLEVLEYCISLTRRVILRAHYHPRDFTIFMYKVKK